MPEPVGQSTDRLLRVVGPVLDDERLSMRLAIEHGHAQTVSPEQLDRTDPAPRGRRPVERPGPAAGDQTEGQPVGRHGQRRQHVDGMGVGRLDPLHRELQSVGVGVDDPDEIGRAAPPVGVVVFTGQCQRQLAHLGNRETMLHGDTSNSLGEKGVWSSTPRHRQPRKPVQGEGYRRGETVTLAAEKPEIVSGSRHYP